MNDMSLFINELDILLNHLSPTEQNKLAMAVGRQLRQNQKKRITAQQNPDGSKYVPRKNTKKRKGYIRHKMFMHIKTAKYLKLQRIPHGAQISFAGHFISRIASVHHYGQTDKVSPHPRSPRVRYAARELLGINQQDIHMIKEAVYQHLNIR